MYDKIQQYQYFSKALIALTVTMIGLVLGFFMYHSYQQNLMYAEESELRSLEGIAKTLALNIDGNLHEKLVCNLTEKDAIKSNADNKTYEKMHQLLKETQKINNLENPIYTLFKNSDCTNESESQGKILFGISSTVPFFRHQYELYPEALKNNFSTGGVIGEYDTKNGSWLSAFHPIKNRNGKTVGVVQVDKSFNDFVATARKTLLNESLYALLFLFLVTAGFIYAYRVILESMSKINVTLEEAVSKRTKELNASNHALKGLTEKLEILVEQRTNELKLTNAELEKSNDKLKSFARVASHDLRAPLRSISGFAQLFKRRYASKVDESGNEYLEFIITNAQKMSDLIAEILSTSVTPKENRNELKWVNLNEVVDGVINNLSISISKYKASVSFYNLPTLKGYNSEFVQLFQNLISNSIKYSRPDVPPKVKIVSHQKDDSFLITVSDNGKGISEEALKTIFNEFDRGDVKDNNGFGIGLATCQRIIKEYNGTMKVSSKVGEGTCFFITLKTRQTAKERYQKSVEVAVGEVF